MEGNAVYYLLKSAVLQISDIFQKFFFSCVCLGAVERIYAPWSCSYLHYKKENASDKVNKFIYLYGILDIFQEAIEASHWVNKTVWF